MRILSLLPGDQCAKRSVGNTHQYQESGQFSACRPFVRIDEVLHLRSGYQRMFAFLLGLLTKRTMVQMIEYAQC
jgi:hypothetical protein